MRLRKLATVAAAGALASLTLASPASAAGTTSVEGFVLANADVTVTPVQGHYLACAKGDASTVFVTGSWVFKVTVNRAGASASEVLQDGSTGSSGFSACIPVYKDGAISGNVQGELQYVGVGGQVYGDGTGASAWGPGFDISI